MQRPCRNNFLGFIRLDNDFLTVEHSDAWLASFTPKFLLKQKSQMTLKCK